MMLLIWCLLVNCVLGIVNGLSLWCLGEWMLSIIGVVVLCSSMLSLLMLICVFVSWWISVWWCIYCMVV